MELVVDLDRVTVVLVGAVDADRLAVRVGEPATASAGSDRDVHRLGDVLVAANVGRLVASGQALVRPDAVRFHAAGEVDAAWEGRFDALCRSQAAAVDGDGEPWLTATVAWPSP